MYKIPRLEYDVDIYRCDDTDTTDTIARDISYILSKISRSTAVMPSDVRDTHERDREVIFSSFDLNGYSNFQESYADDTRRSRTHVSRKYTWSATKAVRVFTQCATDRFIDAAIKRGITDIDAPYTVDIGALKTRMQKDVRGFYGLEVTDARRKGISVMVHGLVVGATDRAQRDYIKEAVKSRPMKD